MEETLNNKNSNVLSGLNRILCRIAGSDLSILENPACSHEISRHARIGAIIISTAVLATVSMFFAIQTISQSEITAVIAGIVWGMAIFILDSYIIASYKKSDGKWKELKLILPRLILAIVLGCSISVPLELKFFATEIRDELVSMRTVRRLQNQGQANEVYNARIRSSLEERTKLENANTELSEEIRSAEKEVASLEREMALEMGGNGPTGIRGKGTAYHDLETRRDQVRNSTLPRVTAANTPRISENRNRISEIDAQVAGLPKPVADSIKFTGLSSQMDALKNLTSKNPYVAFTYWIFFLLILGIETAPIFVKFFSPKGSYDEILAMNEYEVMINQQKRKSDLHEMINTELAGIRSVNDKKHIAQEAVNEKIMTVIAEAQSEIAEKAIKLWKLQQMDKLDNDVGAFVKSRMG